MLRRILFIALAAQLVVAFTARPCWTSGRDDANAGVIAYRSGKYEAAVELFAKAIASGDLTPRQQSDIYILRGNCWRALRRLERAVADYDQAAELNPRYYLVYINRGVVWLRMGDLTRAITDFSKSIRYKPDFYSAYYLRALAYQRKGLFKLAAQDAQHYLGSPNSKSHPQRVSQMQLIVASVAMGAGPRTKRAATAAAKRAKPTKPVNPARLKAKPGAPAVKAKKLHNPYALAKRSLRRKKAGDYSGAARDLREALALKPNFPTALNRLAWLLSTCPEAEIRNGKEAVRLAQKAYALRPVAGYLDTLAAAHAETGDFAKAVSLIKRALAMAKSEKLPVYIRKFKARLAVYQDRRPWRDK